MVAFAAAVLLGRGRLARTSVGAVLTALLVSLPVLALLGPSFALPAVPQAFLFRIVLAVVVCAGVCYLVVRRDPMPFAAKDLLLPAVLWFAWLLLGMVWSPDKLMALNYIAIVVTMVAVLLATAAAGGTRRRLIWFGYTMLLGYAFVVGFTILEARLGIRLPTSRLLTTVTSQTYAVTSVFHNQNDLATYIVMCWPFMLCAFFFTRKLRWLALTLLFMAMGAAAFVRTGSRSSLVAAGISSLAAVVLFWHLGPRLSSRTGKVVMGLVIVGLVVVAGWLLFNNSSNDMLRQFRLESLLSQAEANKGSGAIRSNLTERGLQIAGGTWLLGAGPGQAEGIIGSGTDALGISNLHNWWLETYADGGLVGLRPAPRLLPAAGDRAVADGPARPRPADAVPGLRDVAGAARLDDRVRRPEQLRQLRADVDPVRTRARGGLALPAGGATAGEGSGGRTSRRGRRGRRGPPVKLLVISHLYPSPGVERHLFVHEQLLALRELGVEAHVISPTPYAPRVLWRNERQRRRGEKPREAVRDGITAEYPRVVQPPKRLLFDRLGDLAYRSVCSLPSVTAGEWDLIHAHQALPDGALAQRLAADLRVPWVVTVHGADVYQHFRMGGSGRAPRQGPCSAPPTR